jgi:hypothetical protein
VAIRILNANLEPSPIEKLDHACILFQSAAEVSSRALRALVGALEQITKRATDKPFWAANIVEDAGESAPATSVKP